MAFGGGYAFGLVEGTLVALLAQVMGCAVAFFYARLLGRSLIQHRFGPRVRRMDTLLAENTFTSTLLIRFLPVGANVVTNLAAGVSSARALPFLSGSAVGYIPQTLIFALLGTGVQINGSVQIGLSVVLFILSGLLGVALYRRVRHKARRTETSNKI